MGPHCFAMLDTVAILNLIIVCEIQKNDRGYLSIEKLIVVAGTKGWWWRKLARAMCLQACSILILKQLIG
jgi:hypothetical protein